MVQLESYQRPSFSLKMVSELTETSEYFLVFSMNRVLFVQKTRGKKVCFNIYDIKNMILFKRKLLSFLLCGIHYHIISQNKSVNDTNLRLFICLCVVYIEIFINFVKKSGLVVYTYLGFLLLSMSIVLVLAKQ